MSSTTPRRRSRPSRARPCRIKCPWTSGELAPCGDMRRPRALFNACACGLRYRDVTRRVCLAERQIAWCVARPSQRGVALQPVGGSDGTRLSLSLSFSLFLGFCCAPWRSTTCAELCGACELSELAASGWGQLHIGWASACLLCRMLSCRGVLSTGGVAGRARCAVARVRRQIPARATIANTESWSRAGIQPAPALGRRLRRPSSMALT